MDYGNFVDKCKENGYTPSALVKELGISDGNLGSWKKGGNPSPAVLKQITDKLHCSTDYLLGIDNTSVTTKDIIDKTFKSMKAIPQRIASIKRGGIVESVDALAKYFQCEPGFLLRTDNILYKKNDGRAEADRNMEYKVMDILDRCADSDDYKALQIQISRIILFWLRQSDSVKFGEVIKDKRLSQGKMGFLLDGKESRYSSENYGLNLSDVLFLRGEFDVSFSYMFVGAD